MFVCGRIRRLKWKCSSGRASDEHQWLTEWRFHLDNTWTTSFFYLSVRICACVCVKIHSFALFVILLIVNTAIVDIVCIYLSSRSRCAQTFLQFGHIFPLSFVCDIEFHWNMRCGPNKSAQVLQLVAAFWRKVGELRAFLGDRDHTSRA